MSGKTAYVNGSKIVGRIEVAGENSIYNLGSAELTKVSNSFPAQDGVNVSAKLISNLSYCKKVAIDNDTKLRTYVDNSVLKEYLATNENLLAENIKSGVTILGVTGTYTGSSL